MSDFSGADLGSRTTFGGLKWASRIVGAVLFVSLAVLILQGSALAQINSPCGMRSEIIDTLNNRYAEKPVATGLTQGGGVIEVFDSGSGSWTMIITLPTGRACFMAAGENWESLSQLAGGTQISH